MKKKREEKNPDKVSFSFSLDGDFLSNLNKFNGVLRKEMPNGIKELFYLAIFQIF